MAADLGTGFINVLPRTTSFGAQLISKIRPALDAVERSTGLAFSNMELAGVAAFAGIAAASLHFATDYEASLARIQGLVGLTADETARLHDQVLNLATQVPVGPQELADSLYFIESAGQRGDTAMETLRVSAEAAAAGLGDTRVVADAVTSAMNSYAQSGLSATQATDVLIAAVREGKLEPAQLAQNLGQVLPIASQVGVSFDQVAAAIASSTREGLQASRAATGVRYLLSSFIRPSAQAEEALAGVGISLEDLSNMLANRGLLPTLQTLADRFDISTAAGRKLFSTVVGGVRGMSTASILVGENGKAVQEIFENVANSAGSLGVAFGVAQDTMAVQTKQLVSDLQVLAIEWGETLLPVAKDFVSVLTFAAREIRPFIGFLADGAKALVAWYVVGKVATLLSTLGARAGAAAAEIALLGEAEAAAGAEATAFAAAESEAAASAGAAGATAGVGGGLSAIGAGLLASRGPLLALAGVAVETRKTLGGVLLGANDLANEFHITEDAATSMKDALVDSAGFAQIGNLMFDTEDRLKEFGDAYSQVAQKSLDAGVSQEVIDAALQKSLGTINFGTDSVGEFTSVLEGAIISGQSIAVVTEKYGTAQEKANADIVLAGKGMALLNHYYDLSPRGLGRTTAALQQNSNVLNENSQAYKDLTGQEQLLVDYGKQITSGYKTIGPLFGAMGTSMGAFQAEASKALSEGKWEDFANTVRKDAAQAIADFAQSARENLSFVDEQFTSLGEHVSAQALVGGLADARKDTQRFAGDLQELGKVLHGQGQALASYLLTTGDAAHAATLAAASPQLQRAAVHNFNAQQHAVTSLSDVLTSKLLPTLKNMNDLLRAIEGQYNVTMNLSDHVSGPLHSVGAQLKYIEGHQYIVDIYGVYHKPATGPASSTPQGPYGTGAIIPGASGYMTRQPTYLIGEGSYGTPAGRGGEAVIPLNARGAEFMRRAWGKPDKEAAPVMMNPRLSGDLHIDWRRGVASLEGQVAWEEARLTR